MSLIQWVGMGLFGGILAAIVFVQAGRLGGANGGEQSATIINAAGSSLSNVVKAVETGGG